MRGDVHFVNLSPRSGAEQAGRRPCVVVSHDAFTANPRWQSVTVVPMTTAARWLVPSPTTVTLAAGESGLTKACAALAHQVTTLDRSKLEEPRIGQLSPDKLRRVEAALRNYLAL